MPASDALIGTAPTIWACFNSLIYSSLVWGCIVTLITPTVIFLALAFRVFSRIEQINIM